MNQSRSNTLAWWSALTIFVSAFLLFQVQPVISKKILPWFGGSPAVWTTCVLFFQLALLGGYAYADWLIRFVPPRRQGVIHISVLILALLTFPITAAHYWNITPSEFWKPLDGSFPAARILLLLTAKVGVPFFIASTTGPLVQAWFSQLYPGRSPYRLYALSNVGSLAALLSYPFLIEVMFPVDLQGQLWSVGFILFAILVGILAWTMVQEARIARVETKPAVTAAEGLVAKRTAGTQSAAPADEPIAQPPPAWLWTSWMALAALASMSFLAITNHLSQDIAVVPFMWVIPLSLYLLSFIICFDNERWYIRKLFGPLALMGVVWLTAMPNYEKVNQTLEWPQKVVRAMTTSAAASEPKEDGKEEPALSWYRRSMNRIDEAQPYARSPFSRSMDWIFDKIGWVVEKLDKGLQATIKPKLRLKFDVATYEFKEHVVVASAAYMIVLFLICMACHGELVKSKPAAKYLTNFYLSISLGGALGGLFVGLVCPQIFKTHQELGLAMIGAFVVGWVTIFNDGRDRWLKGRDWLQWVLAFGLVLTAFLVVRGNLEQIEIQRLANVFPKSWRSRVVKWSTLDKADKDLIAIERNFYGTVTVTRMGDEDDPYNEGRALYNGRIWHGFQFVMPERQLEPSTYYVAGTGAALAVQHNPRAGQPLRVAVIGLGTGSMIAHAKPQDTFIFYDIDPKVVKVAYEYFTYLTKSPAHKEVILGDARLSLERELKEHPEGMNYDVIHLDAFSGDAIPAHLLTAESFGLYEKHLRKDDRGKPAGIIVVHISNRYLDLEPVVAAIARKYDYKTWSVHKGEEGGPTDTASDWILVTKNEEFLNDPAVKEAGEPLKPDKELLWTDQHTALFPILK